MNADNQSNLLLVRVPYSEEISGHAKLRDYILESLPLGVLVLDENITCEVRRIDRALRRLEKKEAAAGG